MTSRSERTRLRGLDMLMRHLGGYVDNLRLVSLLSDGQLQELANKILFQQKN